MSLLCSRTSTKSLGWSTEAMWSVAPAPRASLVICPHPPALPLPPLGYSLLPAHADTFLPRELGTGWPSARHTLLPVCVAPSLPHLGLDSSATFSAEPSLDTLLGSVPPFHALTSPPCNITPSVFSLFLLRSSEHLCLSAQGSAPSPLIRAQRCAPFWVSKAHSSRLCLCMVLSAPPAPPGPTGVCTSSLETRPTAQGFSASQTSLEPPAGMA